MKHQTPESMKFRKLQRKLGCSKLVAVGTLELLWISTQKNTPQGDIGKFSNEEIAIECEWDGDPDELVSALVETGWLDVCSEHRLLVHDWEEHCPGWVKRLLARHKKAILKPKESVRRDSQETSNCNGVTGKSLLTVTDDRQEATPNLTKPNLTKPNQKKSSAAKPLSPPSEDEVRAYCLERENQIDPGHFVDHYTANGWKQANGNRIRDWKAAVRTWERNGFSNRHNGRIPSKAELGF